MRSTKEYQEEINKLFVNDKEILDIPENDISLLL